jgi:hypothetical protein
MAGTLEGITGVYSIEVNLTALWRHGEGLFAA